MNKPLSAEALSNLIGSIYDCALDPSRWERTLAEIAEAMSCESAILSLNDLRHDRLLIDKSTGWAPVSLEERQKHIPEIHARLNEWFAKGPSLDEPFVASRELTPEHLERAPYVQNCLKPLGIADIMHYFLMRTPTHFSEVVVGRHQRHGVITDREIELGGLLLPHLRRAVTISNVLDAKSVAASTFESALDAFAVGVVLLDADLGIVHANAAAQAMLSAGDPIRSDRGTLAVWPSPVALALRATVRQAGENEAKIGRRGLGIPVPRADGVACVLHVLPLRHGSLRPGLAPRAVAAVFVARAVSPPPAPVDALAALFDLTAAEARVFGHIAAGMTQAEIARALGVGPSTVKTHLLHVFAKTDTRRQADLVKLGASLALPLQG